MNRGDLNAALAETEAGLSHFPTEGAEWHWRFLALKAEIILREGQDYREPLELMKPDLPASLATSDIAVWRKLTQGIARAFLSQFAEATRLLDEAEALARTNHPDLLGHTALRKGTLAFLQGDSAAAETAYRKTLQIARDQKNLFLEAAALGSLGLISTKREHYDESIDWDRDALQLSKSIGAEGSVARILGNLGWSYFQMGDYENARSLFQQAEESSVKSGLVADQVYWLTNLGVADYSLHDFATAEKESRKALELARKLGEKEGITQCLNNLSYLALERGAIDETSAYNEEALRLSQAGGYPLGELSSSLIAGLVETGRHRFGPAEKLLQQVIQNPAADSSLRWEAEARLAKVYDDEGESTQAEKSYQKAIGAIEATRASLGQEDFRLTFLSTGIEFYDDYVDFLIAHGRPDDALRVAELSRARTLAQGLAATTEAASLSARDIRPQEIAQKLKASLLFYWMGHSHSYLWLITSGKTTHFKLPKASDIDPVVKSYRKALLGMRDAQDAGSSDGKQLYAMLVEPAKKLLSQGSRVILLPAESLYGLNFETLVVPDPQPHFWIEDVTLTTANSLTLLASSTRRPAPKEKSLLLVGNTESPNSDFPALSQAPAEMRQVKQYFPDAQSKVLEGKQATPAAYLSSNPERFAYLHFVTHGTASRTRPLESAVILSKEGDSYKLYARDIVQHHLNANLVTISACNGAGTRAYSGEGLVGLSWAFLRAGAHNVIGALWEVSDASTPQLMDSLYDGVRRGKDPATALRDAKLTLLHSGNVFAKPFYWAPFQLYAGS